MGTLCLPVRTSAIPKASGSPVGVFRAAAVEVLSFSSSSEIIHRTSRNDDSTRVYKHLLAARVHVHAVWLNF